MGFSSVRRVYFVFYNEKGDLVATETVENDCVYLEEYILENHVPIVFPNKYPISEVEILKIVITNPDITENCIF